MEYIQMSSLRGTQFSGAEGLQLQMERFYSKWNEFVGRTDPHSVTCGVKLTMQFSACYSAKDGSKQFTLEDIFFEGTVVTPSEIPTPLTKEGLPHYLKDNLLARVKNLWTQEIGAKVQAVQQELVQDDITCPLYAVAVKSKITFTRKSESGEAVEKTFTSALHPHGDGVIPIPGVSYHIVIV